MDDVSPSFRSKIFQRAKNLDEFRLYRAALEWDLIDPIIIEKREDFKSEHLWKDKLEPYQHQVANLITFCRRLPVTLLADDVGLGKTISTGLIASELISRNRISKILIVCPKLLMPQWKEELNVKFGIPSVEAVGKDLITAKPPGKAGAVITTYQTARLHLDKITDLGFDMLVLDEAHKLRNLYGVENTPQVALRFRDALAKRLFKYVLMLTATPIQNRLWDLYSLVDLLTVARGHENPFGSQGVFARRFIDDNRMSARKLNPAAQDEFRSIVYGYMSRVRRADAKLHFPERIVELRVVDPTPEELELINAISEPIKDLNFFAQIGILQAVISSPQALVALLKGMAQRGTVPISLYNNVKGIADRISITAKLQGLGVLINSLKEKQPNLWRVVIFTTRRETQITIQDFLEKQGVSCGLINGDSGLRNQETISKFRQNPPGIHVIISTEAGAEGINLQVANVLVNFDLPWNPMIVEQRIGRIQRLSSEYANVCIFNMVLKGTFEEYVVGRLMEKLQMASHAIGDVEALLEASGMNGDDDSSSFEERIRRLVMDSLTGKNVDEAIRRAKDSIEDARRQLESEGKNIDSLLGQSDKEYNNGPQCPQLPKLIKSMTDRDFVLSALSYLGARLIPQDTNLYICELDGDTQLISFDNNESNFEINSILYKSGTASFEKLVSKFVSKGLHCVDDLDQNILYEVENLLRDWASSFNGNFVRFNIKEIRRCFSGIALMRVRAIVAHDSYERLLEISCSPEDYYSTNDRQNINPIGDVIENPSSIGVSIDKLVNNAKADAGITEFCRFYRERLAQELSAAGNDFRKKKKIEDDFTPRLEFSLEGLQGVVNRRIKLAVFYRVGPDFEYESTVVAIPSNGELMDKPELIQCEKTGVKLPCDCIGKCDVTGLYVIKNALIKSDLSGRMALPEETTICSLTGKRVLSDEVEKSAVTGRLVCSSLLRTSSISGNRAEPEFFDKCDFTQADILKDELAISQISGKNYRVDEQLKSVISGKVGHRQEFIFCSETNNPILPTEAEVCELTGKKVVPGILVKCEITGKKVLPSEVEKSVVSGKIALRRFFVSSDISGARLLEEEAIRSSAGKFCTPLESKVCNWSNSKCYPDDLRTCELTALSIHFKYMKSDKQVQLEPLVDLLNGIRRISNRMDIWDHIGEVVSREIGRGCKVEGSELSPDGQHLSVCLKLRFWLGLKVRYVGLVYSIGDDAIVGRIAMGKRDERGWIRS